MTVLFKQDQLLASVSSVLVVVRKPQGWCTWRSKCWTGRWHWGSLAVACDTLTFYDYGREDSDRRKIHPEHWTAYPQKWQKPVSGCVRQMLAVTCEGLCSKLGKRDCSSKWPERLIDMSDASLRFSASGCKGWSLLLARMKFLLDNFPAAYKPKAIFSKGERDSQPQRTNNISIIYVIIELHDVQ